MIFGKKYNVHFDFYSGIIVMIALEKNVTNPQVNNWGGRGGYGGGRPIHESAWVLKYH